MGTKALIRLSTTIEFNATIQPIKLPADCGYGIDEFFNAITVGVGCSEVSRNDPDGILREAHVTTYSYRVCAKNTFVSKKKSIICAEPFDGSAFFGDSGT